MRLTESLLDLLYPRHCPVCHEILRDQRSPVCPDCRTAWVPVREPRCFSCGKPLERDEEEYCSDCSSHAHVYEEGIGIYAYDREKKDSLMKYKYYGRREYGAFFGEACVRYGEEKIRSWEIDGIIPVPLHERKQRIRGFNQTSLIAEHIGRRLGIPVYGDALRKVRETDSQKKLSAMERRNNLYRAFEGAEGWWDLRHVLLVDDVYTTGSTIDAAAAEILRHGVEKVYFLTVFIGKGY